MTMDPFNALVSGGANTMAVGANLMAQQRHHNTSLAEQRAARDQQMMQFMMAQSAMDRQGARDDRIAHMDFMQRDREMALRREESAFARLNQSLDRQLQVAEMESKQRQLAFENTLKAQMFDVEMQSRVQALKEVDRRINGENAYEEFNRIRLQTAAGFVDYGAALDRVGALAQVEGIGSIGPEKLQDLMSTIQVYRLMQTPAFKINSGSYGETFNLGAIDDRLREMNLVPGTEWDADDRQALSVLASRAGVTSNMDRDQAYTAVAKYIEQNKENPTYGRLAAQIESTEVVAQLKGMADTGLLAPVTNPETYSRIAQVKEAAARTQVALMEATGGMFLFSQDPDMRDFREQFNHDLQASILDAITEGDHRAKYVNAGAVNDFMSDIHNEVSRRADLSHTVSDRGRSSGVISPAAVGRNVRALVLGGDPPSTGAQGQEARRAQVRRLGEAGVDPREDWWAFSTLDDKAERFNEIRETIIALEGRGIRQRDQQQIEALVAQGLSALDDYRREAEKYYVDGIPHELQLLLSADRVFPRWFVRQIDVSARKSRDPNYSGTGTYLDLLNRAPAPQRPAGGQLPQQDMFNSDAFVPAAR